VRGRIGAGANEHTGKRKVKGESEGTKGIFRRKRANLRYWQTIIKASLARLVGVRGVLGNGVEGESQIVQAPSNLPKKMNF